jgi:hypothetical protein
MMNWLGFIAFIGLTVAFWIFGKRTRLFCVIFFLMLIGVFAVSALDETGHNRVDVVLTLSGFILYFFGLMIVRLVIDRSVSMHLLLNDNAETRIDHMKEEIDNRISDITRYGLGNESGDVLHLNARGTFMSSVIAILYAIFRIKK